MFRYSSCIKSFVIKHIQKNVNCKRLKRSDAATMYAPPHFEENSPLHRKLPDAYTKC